MDNTEIKQLLIKYITGEANATDISQVKQWISAHPENEQYFVELYEAWQNMLHLKPDFIDDEKAYQRFREKVNITRPIHHKPNHWYKAAAVIVLLVTVCLLIARHYHPDKVEECQIAVSKGTIKRIVLSDGTQVCLNAGSILKYDAGYGISNRSVYLDGEALFDIAPMHKHIPFLIHTKSYIIRDIGTRFNLKSYTTDPSFEAVVFKGEVSVENNPAAGSAETNRIFLKQNQALKILNQSTANAHNASGVGNEPSVKNTLNDIQIQQIPENKLNQYNGWADNDLVFEDKSLGEITRILERRYDVVISLKDADIQGIRYTGSFKHIESINQVMDIIKQNTPITYTHTGKTIVITKTN